MLLNTLITPPKQNTITLCGRWYFILFNRGESRIHQNFLTIHDIEALCRLFYLAT